MIFFLITGTTSAQQTVKITFAQAQDTIRKKQTAIIYPIIINSDSVMIPKDSLHLYTVTAKIDEEKSTLPKSNYKLDFNSIALDKLLASASSGYTFFLTVDGDSVVDRDRHLFLNLVVTKDSEEVGVNLTRSNSTLHITVESFKALNKYNYLGYIGTNFDLIDGVKTRDLFFAVNLFVAPQDSGQGFGFGLTLYGNRTISLTDTSGRRTYTSKIVGLGGDSARFYEAEGLRTITRVSDNLGATFSPLYRIGIKARKKNWKARLNKVSNTDRITQLYYAPQFEFIWRRTIITTTYTDNILIDSTDRPNRPIRGTLVLTPIYEAVPFNIYDVYLGLAGILLKHENTSISIRVQSSFGVNFSYIASNSRESSTSNYQQYERAWNPFFYARAWVTEPLSGLTFGAEVSNIFGRGNYRPYYNVTLSKAINLNALGAIFQPITSR